MRLVHGSHKKEEPPSELLSPKGVFFLVLAVLILSVKPLVDVVCHYTRCDRQLAPQDGVSGCFLRARPLRRFAPALPKGEPRTSR